MATAIIYYTRRVKCMYVRNMCKQIVYMTVNAGVNDEMNLDDQEHIGFGYIGISKAN